MKVYLLDTNIASALWDAGDKHNQQALNFVRTAAARGDHIYISRIVVAEIEYGYALYASLNQPRRDKADAAMRAFKSIKEVGVGTTIQYANIRAELFRLFAPRTAKGKIKNVRPEQLVDKTTALELGIQENDLWMVAVAVEYNMTFVSDDNISRIKDAWPALDLVKWK